MAKGASKGSSDGSLISVKRTNSVTFPLLSKLRTSPLNSSGGKQSVLNSKFALGLFEHSKI